LDSFFVLWRICSVKTGFYRNPARVFLPWQGYIASMLQINVKEGNPNMSLFPFLGILFRLGGFLEIGECQKRVFNLNPDS
jgi:hypothetical protein